LAAAMVAVGHTIGEAQAHLGAAVSPGRFPWTWGVDLFFVISGSVIIISAARHAGVPGGWRRVLAARAIRVVPLYWLFTALMLLALIVAPDQIHTVEFDWGQALASFAFLPYLAESGLRTPILTPGWTLNYELFFYAAIVALLALPLRIGHVVLALKICFGLLAVVGRWVPLDWTALSFWSSPQILEFVFGATIGWIWLRRKGRALTSGMAVPLVLAALGLVGLFLGRELYAYENMPRFLAAGLPATLIVAAAVLFIDGDTDRRLPHWLVALGDSSYALYLSHRFVLRGAAILWPVFLPGASGWIYVVLVGLAAIGVGHLVFATVERPLLTVLRSRFLKRY
jgi:peptidoglycan/LPS O-acetylase OafA/YrhL